MRRLPPLNTLRMFEAAARHLSFSAAAAELCVTHGAVSHQIRQLEDWLGHTVFQRHAGGVRLTAAGSRLQTVAEQALTQLEACCTAIAQDGVRREIVLGAPGSFLANWLIPHLERFESVHPDIRLHLQTSGELAELATRRLDALIVSGTAPWPRTVSSTVLQEELIGPVCAPHWSPLPDTPLALQGQALLHTASRPTAWQEWAAALHLAPDGFAQGRRFDHLPLMLEAATAGLGIGIAPALLVEREIARGQLCAPLGFCPGTHTFSLCVASSRAGEPALLALREGLLEIAGSLS